MKTLPDAGYLLEQLLEGSLDAIYFKDLQSRFIMYNKACARKHGWSSQQEGIGKTDFDVFAVEHAQKAYDDEQHIVASGEFLAGMEEKEVWPDGRITWCSSTKVPMRDEHGTIVGIFGISRDITPHVESRLQTQRYAEQIGAIKGMLEEDARMAGKLQRSFFLAEYPVFPEGVDPGKSCIEFLHHFNKCSLVSGGYCSIRRLSANRMSMLLCDVIGAGVRSALVGALIRGIMQEIDSAGDEPSTYIERLNEQLYPLLHRDGTLLDVTACYLVLDVSTGEARVVSAGHPLPLHFRKGQPAKWLFENLVLRGPALAREPHTKYRTITCRLQPGDSVVLFTNGLFSVRNGLDEPFGEKRVLGTAQELSGQSLGRMFSGLEKAATGFSVNDRFTDDVCLVGFSLRKLMEPQ